jgi:hypothetical protein
MPGLSRLRGRSPFGEAKDIHVFLSYRKQDVDGRVKPGHNGRKFVKYAQTACESAPFGFDAGGRGDYDMRS